MSDERRERLRGYWMHIQRACSHDSELQVLKEECERIRGRVESDMPDLTDQQEPDERKPQIMDSLSRLTMRLAELQADARVAMVALPVLWRELGAASEISPEEIVGLAAARHPKRPLSELVEKLEQLRRELGDEDEVAQAELDGMIVRLRRLSMVKGDAA
jgi:hypothetical protein